jgi:archaemetzincin
MKYLVQFLIFITLISCSSKVEEYKDRNPTPKYTRIGKVIAIQPFTGFSEKLTNLLASKIKVYYKAEVVVLMPISLPTSAYYAPRARFRADKLIAFLKETKPSKYQYIIGLTTKDISFTKGDIPDWGIFGLGYRPGPSCVVSTFRYEKGVLEEVFHDRFLKICLHEIGHNMGLPHCKTPRCMMNDAKGKISTVDNENMDFCMECKGKI